jgi:hypothetical protein
MRAAALALALAALGAAPRAVPLVSVAQAEEGDLGDIHAEPPTGSSTTAPAPGCG